MHFPHFNSLMAVLFLFGHVTAAPVPQEDDASIIAGNHLSIPIAFDFGLDIE